jgi:GNAT superfamily N-acetyltransferase
MDADNFILRPLAPTDSMAGLTALLHRAYRPLAEQGFRFVAAFQEEQVTRNRAEAGHCFVALLDDRVVGTITYYTGGAEGGADWYTRPGVHHFGQFAVDPAQQHAGLGTRMLRFVEALALVQGATELALDTAEGAHGLIAFYKRRGYRAVDTVQWDLTNYPSVILSKTLTPA